MKYIFFIFSLTLLTFRADAALAAVFEVHILSDSAQNDVHLDRSVSEPIVLNSEKNLAIPDFDTLFSAPGPFEFLFFDSSGDRIEDKQFLPKPGKSTLDVPYYSAATRFVLRRTGSQEDIDSFDISRFSRCNRNGICEFEKGETILTCLTDCTSGNFSDETKKLLKQNNDMIRDPKTGEVVLHGIQVAPIAASSGTASTSTATNRILLIVGAVAVLLISAGVFVILRLRARNKKYGL